VLASGLSVSRCVQLSAWRSLRITALVAQRTQTVLLSVCYVSLIKYGSEPAWHTLSLFITIRTPTQQEMNSGPYNGMDGPGNLCYAVSLLCPPLLTCDDRWEGRAGKLKGVWGWELETAMELWGDICIERSLSPDVTTLNCYPYLNSGGRN
jgi:hypothetical protein